MISSAVLNLMFLNELAARYDRNFKFTALVFRFRRSYHFAARSQTNVGTKEH